VGEGTRTEHLDHRQLGRLLEVGRGLVSELDLDAVLRGVIDAARELTGARYAALGVLDAEKRELERFVFVGIGPEKEREIGSLPRGRGILGELIRDPRPLRLARISDHPRSYGFPAGHPPMTTFAGTPVKIRDEVYGNLYLTEKEGGGEFDDGDEALMIILAEWAAIAINNARTHTALEQRREELERAVNGLQTTVELNRQVGPETELARILELVAKRGRALIEARACVLLMLEGDSFRVAQAVGELPAGIVDRTMAVAGSAAGDVLRAGITQAVEGSALVGLRTLGIEAAEALLVPLRSRGAELGVLAALDARGGDGFSADDELLLSSFATGAAAAIADTRAIEDEKLRLSIAASEAERQRWARELHDETLQELGALRMMQESALQTRDVEAMRRALEGASEQVGRVIADLQGLITELRPAALDELGLAAGLEPLIERIRSRSGIRIDLDTDLAWERGREDTRLTPELEATAYRLVQEALTNVVKHAEAGQARVAIEENAELRVTVEDDGRGFDPAHVNSGFGLVGMRERAELAGGGVVVESLERGGTRVRAVLPIARRR
jgi:signal transduction histidine kinase